MSTIEEKSWVESQIKQSEIDKYLDQGKDCIPEHEIWEHLQKQAAPDANQIRDILAKSMAIQTLTPLETAALLNVQDPGLLEEMRVTGLKVKKKVYDNRIVTFAPLYLGNYCVNNCLYCGFRRENKSIDRRILSQDAIRKEVEMLAGEIGHKRLIVVAGEHPSTDVDYIVESIRTIYDVKTETRGGGIGNIRRVNVNAAPMAMADLKKLAEVGVGTFQVFQETYHHETYAKLHPAGTLKSNYEWRLTAPYRSIESGIDDVGIGVLFGLFDWRFEVMAMVYHALDLEKKMIIGPHTVSFPRLEPALNTPFASDSKYRVSDADFLKIITVIRLAIPYTGMIVTARESAAIRREAIRRGVTQTDASTRIGVGAYADGGEDQQECRQQFMLGDTRSLEEVITEFSEMGLITSFCTAGYRCGRTGTCIMDLLRSGQEGKFCKLNAVLTFREWLDDFPRNPTVREQGEKVIEKEIAEIREAMPQVYGKFMQRYDRVKHGERDLYF